MEVDVKEWFEEKGEVFLKNIGMKDGLIVLDFGCNVGHYTIPAAKVVGEQGKVYAMDKDMESLKEMMQRAKSESLKNIVPMHNQSVKLKINLKDESVDMVLIYDVLHYMDVNERNNLYSECYRILKDDAILSVYPKHNKNDEPLWNLSNMQLDNIIKEIESANYNFDGKYYRRLIHDNYFNTGYILNFTKNWDK